MAGFIKNGRSEREPKSGTNLSSVSSHFAVSYFAVSHFLGVRLGLALGVRIRISVRIGLRLELGFRDRVRGYG